MTDCSFSISTSDTLVISHFRFLSGKLSVLLLVPGLCLLHFYFSMHICIEARIYSQKVQMILLILIG